MRFVPESAAPPATHLLIVSAARLFSEGLARAFARRAGFRVIGLAGSAGAALERIRAAPAAARPELVLADTDLEDRGACRLTRALRADPELRSIRVVLVGPEKRQALIVSCLAAGADGHLSPSAGINDLVTVSRRALAGEVCCSTRVLGAASSRLRQLAEREFRIRRLDSLPLTPAELRVLRWVATGAGNREISRRLNLAPSTVKNHVSSILAKLRLRRRVEAVAYARERWWLPPPWHPAYRRRSTTSK